MSSKYENMTRAERRVAIAKDVIKTINAKKFGEVWGGSYVNFDNRQLEFKAGHFEKSNAEELMPHCTVCARGAMMLCKIAKFNGNVIDVNSAHSDDTTEVLKDAFSEEQLELIEATFENYEYHAGDDSTVKFAEDFANYEDRLVAIMQNIIDHKGTFKPKCRYVML